MGLRMVCRDNAGPALNGEEKFCQETLSHIRLEGVIDI